MASAVVVKKRRKRNNLNELTILTYKVEAISVGHLFYPFLVWVTKMNLVTEIVSFLLRKSIPNARNPL